MESPGFIGCPFCLKEIPMAKQKKSLTDFYMLRRFPQRRNMYIVMIVVLAGVIGWLVWFDIHYNHGRGLRPNLPPLEYHSHD